MADDIKAVDTVGELRQALKGIPRARIEFVKAISDLLATHKLSVSGDLMGKLTLADCREVAGETQNAMATWTN
jgi:hypothetical protein